MTKKCTWTETNGGEDWKTACGCEIDNASRLEIIGSYNAEFCPWCGSRIEEETLAQQYDHAEHGRGDDGRDRMLEEVMFDDDRGLA